MTKKDTLYVYVDTLNGIDGSQLWLNGTAGNPVKTMAAAKIIADKLTTATDERGFIVDGVEL